MPLTVGVGSRLCIDFDILSFEERFKSVTSTTLFRTTKQSGLSALLPRALALGCNSSLLLLSLLLPPERLLTISLHPVLPTPQHAHALPSPQEQAESSVNMRYVSASTGNKPSRSFIPLSSTSRYVPPMCPRACFHALNHFVNNLCSATPSAQDRLTGSTLPIKNLCKKISARFPPRPPRPSPPPETPK